MWKKKKKRHPEANLQKSDEIYIKAGEDFLWVH